MIYGKPLMIYGTKICAVSFYGPPGSTVTWGSDPGESVTLNEYGIEERTRLLIPLASEVLH